jgi:S1-C subfamily serine protease
MIIFKNSIKYLMLIAVLATKPSLVAASEFDFVIGSSFLFTSQNHYMTANHVIQSCDNISVLIEAEKYEIEVVFFDEVLDINVFKVDRPEPKDFLKFEFEQPKLGESVIAVGFPMGVFDITVTSGVVSRLSVKEIGKGWLQFDAAIHPGNSGGPLINTKNNVVAVNLAKYQTGFLSMLFGMVYENSSHGVRSDTILPALPSDIVKTIVSDNFKKTNLDLQNANIFAPLVCNDVEVIINDAEQSLEKLEDYYNSSLNKSVTHWNELLEKLKIIQPQE